MTSRRYKETVRLRPVTERSIGTTAFFRNRMLFKVLFEELNKGGQRHYSVLFHASSVGAEVYSFVIHHRVNGYSEDFSLTVHATDLEPAFVDYAANGSYPSGILAGLQSSERSCFLQNGETVQIVEDVRRQVEFLGATNFMDFEAQQKYDVVFLLNALIYVPADQQTLLLDRIASYNTRFLVTTGFHMESIKQDLTRCAYSPVARELKSIHDGWTDRRVPAPVTEQRPGIYADWSLPEFAEIEDHQYKYCSLFTKSAQPPPSLSEPATPAPAEHERDR